MAFRPVIATKTVKAHVAPDTYKLGHGAGSTLKNKNGLNREHGNVTPWASDGGSRTRGPNDKGESGPCC